MKKTIALMLCFLLFAAIAAGCSKQNDQIESSEDSTVSLENNPFESNDDEGNDLGNIGHGIANPELGDDGARLPLRYEGGEMKIEYEARAEGKARNIGFLIFIDGIAQPYKFNSDDAAYEYLHIFDLEDDEETQFSFIFTPVTGKKGETLSVAITSIYYPAFMPDMIETSSYGTYHSIFDSFYSIVFEKDAAPLEASTLPASAYLCNVSQKEEVITEQTLESFNSGMMEDITLETLNKSVYCRRLLGDSKDEIVSNHKMKKIGTFHITFEIFGHPGVRYKNTLYLNHNALTDGKSVSFETSLTKGNVSVVEADIDISKLDDLNTFYVVSVPCNPDDYPDDVITMLKTESVLLYK